MWSGNYLRWFEHVSCQPINAPNHKFKTMVSEGVKKRFDIRKIIWMNSCQKTKKSLLSIQASLKIEHMERKKDSYRW